jgi:nucleoside-diphosphate-sugar epimerase
MKLLVTGATGFLGFRVIEQLATESEVSSIIATGREIRKHHHFIHPKVIYKLGDLCDQKLVQELVKDVDHIVHAAALSSPWGRFEEFEQANLTVVKNIIKVAQASVKRIVFISTPSVYFDNTDRLNISEKDALPSKFINAYAHTKRLAEIEIEKSSIPYVILRPRALIGRGDTVIMPRLIHANNQNKLKVIGDGLNMVDLTAVANVVDSIWLSLQTKTGVNEIYNISNGEPVNLWKHIRMVLELLGEPVPSKKIPVQVAQIAARFMEWKSKWTNNKEPALTIYSVGTLARSVTLDISKARKLLGYEPRLSTEEAILEFVNWFQKHE